ncbi:uncharacterized protein B0H18DRAFT_1124872 [Fomitopsis serialis]|uniref:uncharacterized protein n=1 Tax=Fomitopsis serialis TaxID=139415 RepID=UPI002008A724|nr:uncharacterized protein B0H18DRAFT_1124872 [Neoantrodia serialis]KAH9915481.1 hypothetical protein B0H18DRAFT_1124872 [Neoantrodia serialis]
MRFADIPWPVLPPELSGRLRGWEEGRKDKLRETMLRFHPDKFEGRILKLVAEDERETVMEAVGIVVRVVSGLMGDGK